MQKHLKNFALFYSITLIIICLFLIFVIHLGTVTFIPVFIFSALFAVSRFVKTEKRLPTSEEKQVLVWGNTALAIIIECFIIFFLVMLNPNAEKILQAAENMGILLYAVIMLFFVAIHSAVFFMAYRWFAPFILKRQLIP